MALGYSFTNLLLIISELLKENIFPELEKIVEMLSQQDYYSEKSLKLFSEIKKDTG